MAYKEKECEQCGTKHTKRGRFCSRECSITASKGRTFTAEEKASVSAGLSKWHKESDTAAVAVHKWSQQGLNPTPDPIAPVKSNNNLANNQFVEGGDLWTIDE